MKNKYTVIALTCMTAFLLSTGCGRKEEPATPPTEAPKTVEKPAAEVPKAPETPAPAAQPAAPATAAQANPEVQSLIEKAQGQMADKKYADALASLKDAASKQPSPEQKTLLDQLMAQVQKAMTNNPLGGLPDLKK